jgi:hypothetical protein
LGGRVRRKRRVHTEATEEEHRVHRDEKRGGVKPPLHEPVRDYDLG